jgi:hypothetical protein
MTSRTTGRRAFLAVILGLLAGLALVPVLATASTTPARISPEDRPCVNAILARPTIEYAKMVNPGKPKQSTLFKADYPSIAEVCTDGITRKDQYQFRIKRAGRFVNISQFRLGGSFTRAAAGFIETGVRPSPHDSRDLYHPRTDGPAELQFRNEALAPDGNLLATKTYTVVVETGTHRQRARYAKVRKWQPHGPSHRFADLPTSYAYATNPEASTRISANLEACKKALLALPVVVNDAKHSTKMVNPGKSNQVSGFSLLVAPEPTTCPPSIKRVVKGIEELASPANHKDLTPLGQVVYGGKRGEVIGTLIAQDPHTTADDYQCTPGPSKTPLWLKLENIVKKAGHVIGTSQTMKRMEVDGAC